MRTLQTALGGGDAGHARVEFDRPAQGAAEGLEHGFGDVVGVAAAQVVDVQGDQGVVDEALEEFAEQVHVELADPGAGKFDEIFQAGPAGAVEHDPGQRLVQRHVGVAVAADAALVAQAPA